MRHSSRVILPLLLLALASVLAAGCAGGPKDADKELSAACDRQIKEVKDETGGTKTAKSTTDALAKEHLKECAGQAPAAGADDATAESSNADEMSTDTTASTDMTDTTSTTETTAALDPAARELFANKCGVCHTLADAKSSGGVGPNLDELKPTKDQTATQIKNGGGGMPANVVEGDDVDTVAEYVSAAAGK